MTTENEAKYNMIFRSLIHSHRHLPFPYPTYLSQPLRLQSPLFPFTISISSRTSPHLGISILLILPNIAARTMILKHKYPWVWYHASGGRRAVGGIRDFAKAHMMRESGRVRCSHPQRVCLTEVRQHIFGCCGIVSCGGQGKRRVKNIGPGSGDAWKRKGLRGVSG